MSSCKWQRQRVYGGWRSPEHAGTQKSRAAKRPSATCGPLWTPTDCSLTGTSTTRPSPLTAWDSVGAVARQEATVTKACERIAQEMANIRRVTAPLQQVTTPQCVVTGLKPKVGSLEG